MSRTLRFSYFDVEDRSLSKRWVSLYYDYYDMRPDIYNA